MIAACSVAGGTGSFVAVAVVWAAAVAGGAFLADFVDNHTSPLLHVLLHFCKWDNAVPMCIFLWLVWASSWCGGLQ